MKEYAKTKDYVDYLEQRFSEADKEQLEYIEILAKELHETLSEKPTLPTCCSAMRRVMREGDEILADTDNASGSSTKLKIRYCIIDRKNRACVNLPKRRGRPAGFKPDKKLNSVKKEQQHFSLEEAIISHLKDCEISYEIKDHIILAQGEYGIWKIYIDYAKKGPKSGFTKKIFELLVQFDDTAEKSSLLIMSNPVYEKEWLKLSDIVKQKLNLTLLKCTPHGKIKEM